MGQKLAFGGLRDTCCPIFTLSPLLVCFVQMRGKNNRTGRPSNAAATKAKQGWVKFSEGYSKRAPGSISPNWSHIFCKTTFMWTLELVSECPLNTADFTVSIS